MKRVWLVLVLAGCAALAGCLEPFRAHVAPDVVPSEWNRSDEPIEGRVLDGRKFTETVYTYEREDRGPPFPGVVQIFSLREVSRSGVDDLLRFTRDAVEQAAEAKGINLDPVENDSGERQIKNSAKTLWFTRAGTVETSDLFASGEDVRIVGEAWYDGRSRTSVVAVGMAQVSGQGPIPFQTVRDEATWTRIVGDPAGTISGATSSQGFIYNTVSHG